MIPVICSYANLCDTLSAITDTTVEEFKMKASEMACMGVGQRFQIVIDDSLRRVEMTMNISFQCFLEEKDVKDLGVGIIVRARKYEEMILPPELATLPTLVTVPSMAQAPISKELTIPPTIAVQKITEAYTSVFKARGIDFKCEFITP